MSLGGKRPGAGRKPGGARVPGSGRAKGTPNKKTIELLEIWERLQYDPAEALGKLLPTLEPEKQADIHLKLMPYKYPTRKAVEHTGKDGEALTLQAQPMTVEDTLKLVDFVRKGGK